MPRRLSQKDFDRLAWIINELMIRLTMEIRAATVNGNRRAIIIGKWNMRRARQAQHSLYPIRQNCSGCGMTKPIEKFSLSRTETTGRQSQCKKCRLKMQSSYQRKKFDMLRKNATKDVSRATDE